MSETYNQAMVPGRPRRLRLPPTFNRGVFGGMLGGLLAGAVIVGVQFGKYAEAHWYDPLLIVVAGALAAAAAGAAIQIGIAHATRGRWRGDPGITGGTFGGMIGGLPAGAYLGWFFGYRSFDPIGTAALMGGAVISVIAIVLAVLLHGRRATVLQTVRGLAVSSGVVGLTAFPLLSGLQQMNVEVLLRPDAGLLQHVAGGVLLGAALCGLMGLQIGTTFWVVRRWDELAELEPRERKRASELSRNVSSAFLWAIAAVCLFGGAVSVLKGEVYAGLGFLAMAGSLATAGRIRFKLEHKDFKMELGGGEKAAGGKEDPKQGDPAEAGTATAHDPGP